MTDVKLLQQEDLNMFGALILQLCAGSIGAMNNIAKAAENLGRNYSSDLKNVALFLITKIQRYTRDLALVVRPLFNQFYSILKIYLFGGCAM